MERSARPDPSSRMASFNSLAGRRARMHAVGTSQGTGEPEVCLVPTRPHYIPLALSVLRLATRSHVRGKKKDRQLATFYQCTSKAKATTADVHSCMRMQALLIGSAHECGTKFRMSDHQYTYSTTVWSAGMRLAESVVRERLRRGTVRKQACRVGEDAMRKN